MCGRDGYEHLFADDWRLGSAFKYARMSGKALYGAYRVVDYTKSRRNPKTTILCVLLDDSGDYGAVLRAVRHWTRNAEMSPVPNMHGKIDRWWCGYVLVDRDQVTEGEKSTLALA